MGDVDTRVHIYTTTALGKGREASLTLGRLNHRYSLYRMISGPQDQSGQEGMKILYHCGTRDGNVAVQPVAWAACHVN